MADQDVFEFSVPSQDAGLRLDAFAARHLPQCSRSFAALLIRQGRIWVDTLARKPSYKVKLDDRVRISLPPPQDVDLIAEPMDLDLIYEDASLIAVNKPAGLVVHPAAGHPSGTLVNGLLYHCPDLEGIGGERRPGIVHRLDKDTSGVIVVAKTAYAHHELSRQFKARTIGKRYVALVHGRPKDLQGAIDLPVGRHIKDRKKMSTVSAKGREALTLWRVAAQYAQTTLLEIDLKTGRTHQIRVHCQSMGHPLVGDRIYGGTKPHARLARSNKALFQILQSVKRQMLHAQRLCLDHPVTHARLELKAPLPFDMAQLLATLKTLV